MIQELCNIHTTDLLVAEEFLQGDLNDYINKGLVNKDNISSLDTVNRVFKSPGLVNIRIAYLSAFTKSCKFSIKIYIMLKRAKGKHSYKIILRMKDSYHLNYFLI